MCVPGLIRVLCRVAEITAGPRNYIQIDGLPRTTKQNVLHASDEKKMEIRLNRFIRLVDGETLEFKIAEKKSMKINGAHTIDQAKVNIGNDLYLCAVYDAH